MSARIERRSRRARRGAGRGQGGFTLLEVLIAFAILSVAVVAVIQGFAQGLRLLKAAGDHQQAVLLADQKTREMVTPVEGRDQGKTLLLAEEGRAYVVGRAPQCDLPLADADASREHLQMVRRGSVVLVRGLTAKNGTWIGEARAPDGSDAVWRPTQMIRIARTVLSLEEPVSEALARIEGAADEALALEQEATVPPSPLELSEKHSNPSGLEDSAGVENQPPAVAPAVPASGGLAGAKSRIGWSIVDMLVMAAAIAVLALSLAGLVWLFRG